MSFNYYVTDRATSLMRGIITLVLGCSFLFWPGFTAGLVVKLIAGFLLAIGCVTLFSAIAAASRSNSSIPVLIAINVAVYMIFGLLVFLFPNFFLGLIAFLFGGVLLVAGVSQLAAIYQGSRYAPVQWGMYVIPAAITICGIALFFSPKASTEMLTMIFGGAVTLYGISELLAVWKLRKAVGKSSDDEYTDYQELS